MIRLILVVVFAIASPLSMAATGYIETSVKRVITTDDDEFGGCMFEPDIVYSSEVSCPAGSWISLDCAGTFGSRHAGQRRYDLAMLASLRGMRIAARLDDAKKFGRYCVADRVRTLRSTSAKGFKSQEITEPSVDESM